MWDRRCFLCLKRGNRASACNRSVQCRKCKKCHHQTICNVNKTPEDHSLPKNGSTLENQQANPEGSNNTNHMTMQELFLQPISQRDQVLFSELLSMARETSN